MKQYGELGDNLRNMIRQSLILIYALEGRANPEGSAERRIENLPARKLNKWHTFCYWRLHDVEKLKKRYLESINNNANLWKTNTK